MSELYQQANAYRLHQDNLRWTLFAGYSAFFAGVAQFRDDIGGPAGIGLVVVANLFLLVLAVESWYYNLLEKYVADCESSLVATPPKAQCH